MPTTPETPDVIVSITRYTVSVLPADDINRKYFSLYVELKSRGWLVHDGHQYYGPDGLDGDVVISESTAHWFADYDDALALARRLAPHLTVNGHTATDAYHRTHPAPTPMTVYLATPCDACKHTLNWHRNDVGCTVPLCTCGRYQAPAGGDARTDNA